MPVWHLCPEAHAWPQEPQLALSVCRSLHVSGVEPQSVGLGVAQGQVVSVLVVVVVVVLKGVVVVVPAGLCVGCELTSKLLGAGTYDNGIGRRARDHGSQILCDNRHGNRSYSLGLCHRGSERKLAKTRTRSGDVMAGGVVHKSPRSARAVRSRRWSWRWRCRSGIP